MKMLNPADARLLWAFWRKQKGISMVIAILVCSTGSSLLLLEYPLAKFSLTNSISYWEKKNPSFQNPWDALLRDVVNFVLIFLFIIIHRHQHVLAFEAEKLQDPAFVEELRGHNSVLRTCIDQLTTVELSRTRLVTLLREALQEQVSFPTAYRVLVYIYVLELIVLHFSQLITLSRNLSWTRFAVRFRFNSFSLPRFQLFNLIKWLESSAFSLKATQSISLPPFSLNLNQVAWFRYRSSP